MLIMSAVCRAYTISESGKQFIKDHEQCVLTAYWDSNGYSIGYGHHAKDVYQGMRITEAQADKYFEKDIKMVEEAANRIINSLPYKYKFSQGFFDGLCSFVYNCGEGGAKNSEFYRRLRRCRVRNEIMNESDFNFTLAAIKKDKISAKGHEIRRANEYSKMLS